MLCCSWAWAAPAVLLFWTREGTETATTPRVSGNVQPLGLKWSEAFTVVYCGVLWCQTVGLNPNLVTIVSLNPNLVTIVSLNPNLVTIISLNPNLVTIISLNPNLVNIVSLNPNLVTTISLNPNLFTIISVNPNLVTIVSLNPNLFTIISLNPNLINIDPLNPNLVTIVSNLITCYFLWSTHALFLCLCIDVYIIICTYRYVYMNTCVCMYVDYGWAYMPKHICRCKSMSKFVIWVWAILLVRLYNICRCVGVCVYV